MVDLVLTHTCPLRDIPAEMFLPGLDQSMVDRSTENGTTLDLLTRTFFRFCVDPKNWETVECWVSEWKKSQKEGDGEN